MISPDPKAGYFWRGGVQYVARGGGPRLSIQAGVFTGPGISSLCGIFDLGRLLLKAHKPP